MRNTVSLFPLRKARDVSIQKLVSTPDAVLKWIAKDVFAVVKKPFKPDELVGTVKRLS